MCHNFSPWEILEIMSLSQPRGIPEKVGGLFSILAIKMPFLPIYCYFLPPCHFSCKFEKMPFNGQNRKKFRKQTLIIFQFYMKVCPPTFSGGPQGWENDIFSKNRTCLIWWHISPEPLTCPEWKNIGLTLGAIRKTSFRFSRHVLPAWARRVHLWLISKSKIIFSISYVEN